MAEQNSNWANWGLLILRLGIAVLLIINHGWGKFTGAMSFLFGGKEWGFINFIGSMGFPWPTFFALCAALAEFIGCLLVAVGLFTRYAATLIAITMAVAVFYHVRTNSGFELAAVYFLTAIYFALAGAGKFSLDEWLRKRSSRKLEKQQNNDAGREPEWEKVMEGK